MTIRAALLLLLLLLPATTMAAPRAELWARWTAHDPDSTIQVDHSAWDRFLSRHVSLPEDGITRLAYGAVTAADKAALAAYVERLAAVPVSRLNRAEQFAYWVNLYNALTVKVVLDHYPVDSIREIDISPGMFTVGPWGKKLVTIEGEAVSLDDIEHRVLRPIWKDPRVHYAVNCASIGCPNLQSRAFTAANTEALLDQGARAYVNHPRGASVRNGRLTVSSIYDWFEEDFGGDEAGVIAHLRRYAAPPLRQSLEGIEDISSSGYRWDLNSPETR